MWRHLSFFNVKLKLIIKHFTLQTFANQAECNSVIADLLLTFCLASNCTDFSGKTFVSNSCEMRDNFLIPKKYLNTSLKQELMFYSQ